MHQFPEYIVIKNFLNNCAKLNLKTQSRNIYSRLAKISFWEFLKFALTF